MKIVALTNSEYTYILTTQDTISEINKELGKKDISISYIKNYIIMKWLTTSIGMMELVIYIEMNRLFHLK
ncbi:hypothetical protein QPK80_20935 [Providencia rettgeri]|nr:hypothetical protein [Providencia rettgeri]